MGSAALVAVGVALHVLEGGLVAGDLDELHDQEHGDPDELEGGPESEEDGPWVAVYEGADGGVEYRAGGGGLGVGDGVDVCEDEADEC